MITGSNQVKSTKIINTANANNASNAKKNDVAVAGTSRAKQNKLVDNTKNAKKKKRRK